ncbi:thioredoxin family protein [Yeosuana marina]|uniref:thioredoxin family protein n=1 Tax=Yeosuana marina TaxID=1565536 RepID=UPI0030EC2C84|tara:strand:- start:387 stop:905 length:519 start_codon:yes stop_codon:yes gene_type:complete
MKQKLVSIVIMFIVMFNHNAFSQESSDVIQSKATEQAQKENKHVFIMFHASWCGWCKKMDSKMNDPACKDLFENNYVIEHLVVKESPANKELENPGAEDLLAQYKGSNSGIPFWLFFDENGKFLDDSFDLKGNNLGCPVSKEEVSLFIGKLRKTSSLNEDELATISTVFLSK